MDNITLGTMVLALVLVVVFLSIGISEYRRYKETRTTLSTEELYKKVYPERVVARQPLDYFLMYRHRIHGAPHIGDVLLPVIQQNFPRFETLTAFDEFPPAIERNDPVLIHAVLSVIHLHGRKRLAWDIVPKFIPNQRLVVINGFEILMPYR